MSSILAAFEFLFWSGFGIMFLIIVAGALFYGLLSLVVFVFIEIPKGFRVVFPKRNRRVRSRIL